MRADLEHLPERQQRELERVRDILLAGFEAAKNGGGGANSGWRRGGMVLKIILFGSYARTDWVDEPENGYLSDFDLLVVVSHEKLTNIADYWWNSEDAILRDTAIGRTVNIIVHDLQDVNDALRRGEYFWTDIVRDGVSLYSVPGHPLATPQPMTSEDAVNTAERHLAHWLKAADRFLKLASISSQESVEDADWRKNAAFNLHQAVEAAYACFLLVHTFYFPRSHNIKFLRSLAEDVDTRLVEAWPREQRADRRRFPGLGKGDLNPTARSRPSDGGRLLLAPSGLQAEMKRLVGFKTATLTPLGYQRSGVWGMETASQKIEHFSLMFGALAADSAGPVRGCDVPKEQLTMGLLIFPQIWDWYVQWRAERRGFYTTWEAEMLNVGVALARKDTGWLRQSPHLAENITPVPGLISADDVEKARSDWEAACERFYVHALTRAKEIMRVSRVHRDPFEPILPILESDSPVGEYRKIADEVLRLMPDERRFPRATAEAVRAYLLIRLGLHLGLRQKNLRQLLVCPRGERPRSERALEDLKCGELRWSERDQGWEVLVPAVAFKNAHSSFFGKKPYRLVLPDLEGLYDLIDAWIERHRPILLGQARDPQTFFVKTVKTTSADAAYNQTTFYEAWRLTIQRYGIYNPYTGRGAIEGLLPHGPHNVRDVLATHILKKTGSYEQASYAIQDTPETVADHYGRFLPQDKAALAAQILNQVWLAA